MKVIIKISLKFLKIELIALNFIQESQMQMSKFFLNKSSILLTLGRTTEGRDTTGLESKDNKTTDASYLL